jgi:hypothetical protein
MIRAEQALGRVRAEDEPFWTRFFTTDQLRAEFTYAALDLRRSADVRTFAEGVLAASYGMERRQVLVTAALASSYLPTDHANTAAIDVDQACAILEDTVPLIQILTTRRGVEAVNRARQQLAPYRDRQPVRELEANLQPLLGTVA